MEKPTLLIAADTYYPKVDGVLMFMEEFTKRAKNTFNVRLLVPQFSTEEKFSEVKVTFLTLSRRLGLFNYRAIRFSLQNLLRIKQAVREADMIFIQELGPVGIFALHYASRYRKRKIFYVHNTAWEFLENYFNLSRLSRMLIQKYYLSLYNKGDLLLIPYFGLEKELREAGITAPIEVARLGVDVERFTPPEDKMSVQQNLNLSPPVIGYVGRISKEKNTLVLLRAFKKLKGGTLLIVGDGNKELVEKFKNTAHCVVTGFVRDVEKYLKAMDFFVMPSLTETTSLATLEAMSAGLPVLATRVGFLKNYIVRDYNGLFFPKNNAAILALKIEKVWQDFELRRKLAENARKTIVYSFSWDRSIEKIISLLLYNLKDSSENIFPSDKSFKNDF